MSLPLAKMAVILITPDSYATIRRTVEALQRQTIRRRLELVFVAPASSGFAVPKHEVEGFACCQVVVTSSFTSTAMARECGVRAATAPVVAFAEDHCFPDPHWAEALLARHQEPWCGVGPVFANGNPDTATSWANFLIEYGGWAEPVASQAFDHIPGHNSSYKKAALLSLGDRLGDLLEAESILQWTLAEQGHRLFVEAKARVYHWNYSLLLPSLALRFQGGRLFAATRALNWSLLRRCFYVLASPLIPLVRVLRLLRNARQVAGLRMLPNLCLLLAADGWGEGTGYALGAGDSMRTLADYEFHRQRFLTAGDRKAFDRRLPLDSHVPIERAA